MVDLRTKLQKEKEAEKRDNEVLCRLDKRA